MSPSMKRFLYWTPRIVAIAYVAFISLFALDVFNEAQGFLQTALALSMHLIPSFVLVLVLAIAWRREWIGAAAYLLLAATYVIWGWGKFHWSAYVLIAGPLVILGGLFLAGWLQRSELRPQE